MRRMNREINLFGMASLDLFASALGAFILIAIVIFPNIANTSRAAPVPLPPETVEAAPLPEPIVISSPCPEVADTETVECPVCPEPLPIPFDLDPVPCPEVEPVECPVCPEVPTPVESPEAPVEPEPVSPTFRLPHLDLVIVLDITSSMGPQIASLKAEVGQLSEVLSRLTPSLGIGLVAFGDRFWQQPMTTFALRQISGPTVNRAAFRGFVNGLEAGLGRGRGSNGDAPEAVLPALDEAARMSWRPQSESRVIVLITDNPAYPEDVSRSVTMAATLARSGSYKISTVYVSTTIGSAPNTQEFLQQLANAGRGQFVRDDGGSLTVNLLLSLL